MMHHHHRSTQEPQLSSLLLKKNNLFVLVITVATLAFYLLLLRDDLTMILHPAYLPPEKGNTLQVRSPSTVAPQAPLIVQQRYQQQAIQHRHQHHGKTQLILITPTNRPSFLTRAIPHVFPLLKCFDVRWLIIHTFEFPTTEFVPFFRNVFPFITEMTAYDPTSSKGGHERNVGRDYVVATFTGDGIVYFLDDDNTLPDLCTVLNPKELSTDIMYFADQLRCGRMRLNSDGKEFSNVSNIMPQLSCKMDTGSFLIPLELMRQSTHIMWGFRPGADAPYLGALIRIWVTKHGGDSVRRLPQLTFNYNHLSEKNDGCLRAAWSKEMLNESITEYHELLERMTEYREERAAMMSSTTKESSGGGGGDEGHHRRGGGGSEVVLHDYAHLITVLRRMLPTRIVKYLEVGGVGIGSRALLMSRQELPTASISVDPFSEPGQREEALAMRKLLQGKGEIDWIEHDSVSAIPIVRNLLQSKYNTTHVDILYLNGNRSISALLADFEAFVPMVEGGGYVVIDEFMDVPYRRGGGGGAEDEGRDDGNVRRAILLLMRDRFITLELFDVIGTIGNDARAGAYPVVSGSEFTSADWPRSSSKLFVLRKKQETRATRPLLIVLTGTTNPAYLTRTLHDMAPLRRCVDLRWVIVHGIADARLSFNPLFRDMFSWITEIAQFGEESWPVDVGLEHIANTFSGDGFVYFLDEENVLPDLCDVRAVEMDVLDPRVMYYADQKRCGKMRLNTLVRIFNDTHTMHHQMSSKMDTGNFFVPLQLLNEATYVRWRVHRGTAFFAVLANILLRRFGLGATGSALNVRRIPTLTFNCQHHRCKRVPWLTRHLNESLLEYRDVLQKMTAARDKLSAQDRCVQFPEVVPHEYNYIVHVLRKTISPKKAAVYLEIGVGLGATSILMARFGVLTHVIGVDPFHFPHQREEAARLKALLLPGERSKPQVT
ncbi:membrane-associated protein, putative [Bodo saltans]|uniref:Membrane-associated protein, putative n=1 Tax=Bodo saltans TaxID=75058 RepID=A0A0S4JP88_BODSA|nr:membrane-associated protein, putative [Bodo saltans]|eukprot:CUG93367.1 membrane-associated protein, putative [Bodo saltans]